MSLFNVLKKSKPLEDRTKRANDDIDLKKISDLIKNKTQLSVKRIVLEDGNSSIFESKLGGIPYWNLSLDYPKDKNGNMLTLLAQLEYKNGLLQFFIYPDESYGLDFENQTMQNGFRVVFHKSIDFSVDENDVLMLGMPVLPFDDDSPSPVLKESKIKLVDDIDYINPSNYNFDECFKSAVFEETGIDLNNQSCFEFLGQERFNEFASFFKAGGSKLFGYPSFCQEDPRHNDEFNTMLLQIDTDLKNGIVKWGDSGQANFFINSDMLKSFNFSRVLYNWDCF